MEDRPPIGAILREARQRRDLGIGECAQATRIRERYLVAIEDGRYESLPDPAYINGFVRAYADYLGVVLEGPVQPLAPDHELPPPGGRTQRPVRVRATRAARSAPGRRGRQRRRPTPLLWVPAVIVIAIALLSAAGIVDLPFV